MDSAIKHYVPLLSGLALIVMGVMVSSDGVMEWMRGASFRDLPIESTGKLLQGAMWFKATLLLLGLAVIWLFRDGASDADRTVDDL